MDPSDVAGVLNLSKSWNYDGNADACRIRHGTGTERWDNHKVQQYIGSYHADTLHGRGKYKWGRVCYEGKIYANNIHGYGLLSYPDGSYFEGLFKSNQRFGPGVLTYLDTTQDVGLWTGNQLIRLPTNLTLQCVPNIATSFKAKVYLTKYKKIIPLSKSTPPIQVMLDKMHSPRLQKHAMDFSNKVIRNPKSLFFDFDSFDEKYFCDQKIDVLKAFKNNGPLFEEETVTDLLAWNNEEDLIRLRQYIFLHRNFEQDLSYEVEDVVGQRDIFASRGKLETACEELFNSICDGENKISTLITNYDLNPDVCDSSGNTSIHCAVSRDNLPAIRKLTYFGANLDRFNDECLTPLLISILRFLEAKEKILLWEDAFLPSMNPNIDVLQPYILDLSLQVMNLPEKKKKIKKTVEKKEKKVKAKKGKEKKVKGKAKVEVQEPKPVEPVIDLEQIATDEKLSTIYRTIITLLDAGCDPNIGEVPFPPLFLSIFTVDNKVVLDLISHGANCNLTNAYQDGSLTPLHLITAMKRDPELPNIAQTFLKNGAQPNPRTNDLHWPEEKLHLDPELTCYDEGKTPLHILCMRYDYIQDEEDHLGCLYDTMVQLNCDPNLFYLGHTCLSLAVLRGNLKLIDHILKTYEVDPNQYLGCSMGVPLTVLILKRYKNQLPLYACQEVFDLLIQFKANPFNTVSFYNHNNAIEFCVEENKPEAVGKKVKINKKDPHFKVIQCLYKNVQMILDKHIMAKAVKYIYNMKIMCDLAHPIFDAMVQFLDIKETQRILQIFINRNYIKILPGAITALLEYVKFRTHPRNKSPKRGKKKSSKNKKNIEEDNFNEYVENLKKQEHGFQKINIPEPEVDTEKEKYKVCYNCFKKANKTLVLCPNCELVYFCSVECNKINLKKKTRHKCKGSFYIEELKKISEGKNEPSALNELKRRRHSFLVDPFSDFEIKYSFGYPTQKYDSQKMMETFIKYRNDTFKSNESKNLSDNESKKMKLEADDKSRKPALVSKKKMKDELFCTSETSDMSLDSFGRKKKYTSMESDVSIRKTNKKDKLPSYKPKESETTLESGRMKNVRTVKSKNGDKFSENSENKTCTSNICDEAVISTGVPRTNLGRKKEDISNKPIEEIERQKEGNKTKVSKPYSKIKRNNIIKKEKHSVIQEPENDSKIEKLTEQIHHPPRKNIVSIKNLVIERVDDTRITKRISKLDDDKVHGKKKNQGEVESKTIKQKNKSKRRHDVSEELNTSSNYLNNEENEKKIKADHEINSKTIKQNDKKAKRSDISENSDTADVVNEKKKSKNKHEANSKILKQKNKIETKSDINKEINTDFGSKQKKNRDEHKVFKIIKQKDKKKEKKSNVSEKSDSVSWVVNETKKSKNKQEVNSKILKQKDKITTRSHISKETKKDFEQKKNKYEHEVNAKINTQQNKIIKRYIKEKGDLNKDENDFERKGNTFWKFHGNQSVRERPKQTFETAKANETVFQNFLSQKCDKKFVGGRSTKPKYETDEYAILKTAIQTENQRVTTRRSLGDVIDMTTELSNSLMNIMRLDKKCLPYVVLNGGQMFYKFSNHHSYCHITNYSYT